MASNTMPRCKYGLACRIIDPVVENTAHRPLNEQHWYKFQHPCFWTCLEGHPELGPPGVKVPLHPRFGMTGMLGRGAMCPPCMGGMIVPCTNMDADHRRCFRHPEDDEEVDETVDEAPDEMDADVISDEKTWSPPELGAVDEEAGMNAKMEAAEAAAEGDFAKAVEGYSKALAAAPSALTYAKRAEALLQIGFPSAAVADCAKAKELNADSAKPYKVAAKALTKLGDWTAAYAELCIGNRIDEDEGSVALQKKLKAKVDKARKIGEQQAKRADALFTSLGLEECWASLEVDLLEKRPRGGGRGLEALKQWAEEQAGVQPGGGLVGLKARLGELGAKEEQMDKLLAALKDL